MRINKWIIAAIVSTALPALASAQQGGMGGMSGMNGMGGMSGMSGMSGMGGMSGMSGMGGPTMDMGGMNMSMGPGGMRMQMPGGPPLHAGHGCMANMAGAPDGGPMLAPLDQRLPMIKTQLAITAQQNEQWDAYVKAALATVKAHGDHHADMMKARQAPTLPEQVDAHLTSIQAMVTAMTKFKVAVDALYAALSTEQKHVADSLGLGRPM